MALYFNFILFSVYLSYIITQALLRSGHVIDSQKSIMILLIMVGAMAWIGKWLSDLAEKIEDQEVKEGVTLSTFIWTGHAVGLIFAPSGKLSALAFIPFIAIFAAVYRPMFFKARGYTPFLAGMSALAQVASLAYILRIGGDFSSAFGVAFVIWLIGASIALRFFAREDDGGWGSVISYGQAVPVFWFFLNISNQVISYSERASVAFMGLAVVGLAVAAWAGRRSAQSPTPGGWIVWAPAMLFGLSLLVNFNIVLAMGNPITKLDPVINFLDGYHFWYHITPGFDFIYQSVKPFKDYIPGEGAIFGVYAPRILFEYLDSGIGGYLIFLHLAGRTAFLLFIVATILAFRDSLKITPGAGFLLAAVIAATNIIPMQVYYGDELPYCWVALERLPMLFAAFLVFRQFYLYAIEAERGVQGAARMAYLAGFMTGAAHTVSILFELTFGGPALLGLLAAVFLSPSFSARLILSVAAGGILTALAYTLAFDITAKDFFYYYPLGLASFGKEIVDTWGMAKESVLECFEHKPSHQIFDALSRSRVTLTLHHTLALAVFIGFLAVLPSGARRRPYFALALYLAVTIFAIYISRGQKFTAMFMGPYTLVYMEAMALGLLPALLAYVLYLLGGKEHGQYTAIRSCGFVLSSAIITIGFVNGFHLQNLGMPGWAPFQKEKKTGAAYISRGLDEAFDHMYSHLGRKTVAAWPQPHQDYLLPYSKMRDKIFDMANINLIPIRGPYSFGSLFGNVPMISCKVCVDGPKLAGLEDNRVYGTSAEFRWDGQEGVEYSLTIRSELDRTKVFHRGVTDKPYAQVSSLPADFTEIILDLRVWRQDGTIARTTRRLTSLPERMKTDNAPALAGHLDPEAPQLLAPAAFLVAGKSVELKWSHARSAGYDVAVGGHIDSGEGAWVYFQGSAAKESITVTGLPADCRLVYIHLEAKARPEDIVGEEVRAGGKWNRNSYLIYSAPEGFDPAKGGCHTGD